jgi:hypothetical protein
MKIYKSDRNDAFIGNAKVRTCKTWVRHSC